MRNVITNGFLTDSSKTISFTIPVNKPIIAQEIDFSLLNVQIRTVEGEILFSDDVMESDYSVLSEIVDNGISVNIISEIPFDAVNNMPLSVYIVEAQGRFA